MKSKSIFAALILATLLAAPASAVVLGLDWGTGQSPVTFKYFGANRTVYAGSMKGYMGGQIGAPLPPNDGTYFGEVFCVDLSHSISLPTEYEVETLTTAELTNGGQVAWLFQHNQAAAKNDTEVSAALQLALWDVVTDGGDGLSVGNFQYLSGATSKTSEAGATMIAESAGQSDVATYLRAVGPYGQSMITSPVPEPGTFGLLGLGLSLLGFGFFRKRS